jgi:hypothetical protein
MRKAIQITTDGTLTELDLDAPEGSLKVLQTAVGGYVQAIDLNPNVTMWVNEEGKLDGLPLNFHGTMFWAASYGFGTDQIVGDIVLTGGVDDEGDTLGLSPEAEEVIRTALEMSPSI